MMAMDRRGLLLVACLLLTGTARAAEPESLRVLTLNAWHGLRSGESKTKFPGEAPERKQLRVEWQLQEIRRLEPDLVLLQEVNPNQREARKYAEALGYDEIHKVTSCGIHLPPIKIPKNMNEGLAILARPGLALRRVGTKRLTGDAACTATYGFQTKESRYALFGELRIGDRRVLVATTHFSAPPNVDPGFEEAIAGLAAEGEIDAKQRDKILGLLARKRTRSQTEAERLVVQIDRHRRRLQGSGESVPVVLGGDLNVEPAAPAVKIIESAGLASAARGPGFLTWNPPRNDVNQGIGSRRSAPLPTFDRPAIEALFEAPGLRARQIDHLFASEGFHVREAEMVLDQERDGILPSDHFGILVVLEF